MQVQKSSPSVCNNCQKPKCFAKCVRA